MPQQAVAKGTNFQKHISAQRVEKEFKEWPHKNTSKNNKHHFSYDHTDFAKDQNIPLHISN